MIRNRTARPDVQPPVHKEVIQEEKKPEEKTFTSGDGLDENEFVASTEPIHKAELVKNDIVKEKPKRMYMKISEPEEKDFRNIGLIGDTVICKDFRAIVKKQGLSITKVLGTILHDWNAKNYNL